MPQLNFDPYKWLALPGVLILSLLGILTMQVVSDLRFEEVNMLMQQYREDAGSGQSAALISRFQILQTRAQTTSENQDDYLAEGRLMSIAAGEYSARAPEPRYAVLRAPVVYVMNLLASLSGSSTRFASDETARRRTLEIAYMYERRRQFKNAVLLYERALADYELNPNDKQYVYLHKGFSQALLGKRTQAMKDLKAVSEINKENETAVTAQVLVAFLKRMAEREATVEKMRQSTDKGVAYYNIMAYNKAIKTLKLVENNEHSQRLYFYRGRAHEEIGETAKALKDYQKVISLNPYSREARLANRRIYMLGTFYNRDARLKKIALDTSKKIRDDAFFERSEKIEIALDLEGEKELEASDDAKDILEGVQTDSGESILQNQEKEQQQVAAIKIQPLPAPVKTRIDESEYLAEETSLDARVALMKKSYRKIDKIFTHDGTVFVGAVTSKNAKVIELLTLFGKVKIKRSEIKLQKKVPVGVLVKE